MNKVAFAGISIIGVVILLLVLSSTQVHSVYACKANEPVTSCGNYKADITRDSMDGSYVTAMYDNQGTPITFEPISHDDSYEKGCWLGIKRGVNGLAHNTCQSSQGEWIILEAPTNKVLK